ncbi:dephospho-CoA kinase [bacterium]|nr:dephospho-CoA kinase [bacterium]
MILGITGGISTGKTSAASVVAGFGVRIVDADAISHYLAGYEPSVLAAIHEHFGGQVFHPYGALDRQALAEIVFADEQERAALEDILHPPITAVLRANVEWATVSGNPLVVVAPLLIEASLTSLAGRLWVVSCSPERQLERLCAKTGLSPEQATRRIEAQMPLEQKKKHADTVIENDGTLEELNETVAREWNALFATHA